MSACWTWKFDHGGRRYPGFVINGKVHGAHRAAWVLASGLPIPAGLMVCHKCDNMRCVRPSHLFLGTQLDNVRDMISKGRARCGEWQRARTHCPKGHAYDDANTLHRGGRRFCRECQREYQRSHREQYREYTRKCRQRKRSATVQKEHVS